jgi:hypothetical protein
MMTGTAVPDWAITVVHFCGENVTSIALVGVVVLCFLYAIKSWQASRRRRSFSVARVPVAQHLTDDGGEIGDLEPQLTDSSGAVQFPARTRWKSLALVAVRALTGGHRVKADVWIPRNPIAEPLVPYLGVGAACEDRQCRARELGSELRVRRLERAGRDRPQG